MVANTSQNTEGIHVWACGAAYVDPAASFRSRFSAGGHWHIHNSLTDWNSYFHRQKLLRMAAPGQPCFVEERHNLKRRMMPVLSTEDDWMCNGTVGWWSDPR